MYSAPESEFVDLHQIDPAVLYGFINDPGEVWVPFSDLSSQQLWALGLGEEKGKVLCCCLFLREHRLFCFSCIVPGLKIGVVDEGIEWGALHFARDEYEYDWSPSWEERFSLDFTRIVAEMAVQDFPGCICSVPLSQRMQSHGPK